MDTVGNKVFYSKVVRVLSILLALFADLFIAFFSFEKYK